MRSTLTHRPGVAGTDRSGRIPEASHPGRSSDALGGRTLTLRDILDRLGPVPAWRVRSDPAPGLATEADCGALNARGGRFELFDGILLEKDVGFLESEIALNLSTSVKNYLRGNNLGRVGGADGFLRLRPDQTRGPDTSIIRWDRMPGGVMPTDAVPAVAPTIAAEVLSRGNTEEEMARKIADYFAAGTELVWCIDPRTRTVAVHVSAAGQPVVLREERGDVLTAGDLLPGFALPLAELFALPDPPASPASPDAGPRV